jgi:hypothetical protein
MNAYITWASVSERYELHIEGKLKAYSVKPHEKGMLWMIDEAQAKGYTVINESNNITF